MPWVLDTNIVLDLWLFQDPLCQTLRDGLSSGRLHWLATKPMREELVRVLGYPLLAQALARQARCGESVMWEFDRWAHVRPVAAKAPYTCKDADDQKFIDLAAQQRSGLLSKDKAVLCMARRMARLGVAVGRSYSEALALAGGLARL